MIATNDPAAIKGDARAAGRPAAAPATLEAVLDALEGRRDLAASRLRDLRSAVTRVAKLLSAAPGHIPLELPVISAKLAAINPAAAGFSTKTLSNIRSDFLAAISASALKQSRSSGKGALSPGWARLLAKLPKRRAGIGLSRLARHASRGASSPIRSTMSRLIASSRRCARVRSIAIRIIFTEPSPRSGTKRRASPGLVFAT